MRLRPGSENHWSARRYVGQSLPYRAGSRKILAHSRSPYSLRTNLRLPRRWSSFNCDCASKKRGLASALFWHVYTQSALGIHELPRRFPKTRTPVLFSFGDCFCKRYPAKTGLHGIRYIDRLHLLGSPTRTAQRIEHFNVKASELGANCHVDSATLTPLGTSIAQSGRPDFHRNIAP